MRTSSPSCVHSILAIRDPCTDCSKVSRMAGFGHLLVYAVGALDLKSLMGNFLGDTQFKQLTVVAAFSLCLAVGLTSWAVTERVLIGHDGEEQLSASRVLVDLAKSNFDLPATIKLICHVQFWAWIGEFCLVMLYGLH